VGVWIWWLIDYYYNAKNTFGAVIGVLMYILGINGRADYGYNPKTPDPAVRGVTK